MGNTTSVEEAQSPTIESAHTAGCSGEDCKPTPYNPNLVGTVGYFNRSVIVCTGEADWPAKVVKTKGTFISKIVGEANSRDNIDGFPIYLACNEASSGAGTDVYVYPDEVKYIGLSDEDIPAFVEDQLVKGKVSDRLKHISLHGKLHALVCTHATRDKRCGRSGPQVLTALQGLIKEKGVEDKVKADGCSHVGGHKYAGVVVVFPAGDYYGYVGSRNAEEVMASYLDPKRPRANQYWRGRMGIDEDAQAKEAGMNAPKKKKDKGERHKGEKQKEEKQKEEKPTTD